MTVIKKEIKQVADALNAEHSPILRDGLEQVALIKIPSSPNELENARAYLSRAHQAIKSYNDIPLLCEKEYRSPLADQLDNEVRTITKHFNDSAPSYCKDFNHFGSKPFFAVYPLNFPNKTMFFSLCYTQIKPKLQIADYKNLAIFLNNYPKDILGNDIYVELSNIYMASLLGEKKAQKKNTISDYLECISVAKQTGFEPTESDAFKIGLLELSGKESNDESPKIYKVNIKRDIPVKVENIAQKGLYSDNLSEKYNQIIITQINERDIKRIGKKNNIKSKYQYATQTLPNPEYDAARIKVIQLQGEYANAQANWRASYASSRVNTNPYAALGDSLMSVAFANKVSETREALEEAVNELRNTPQTIQEPVFREYSFTKVDISIFKHMIVTYYLIDTRNKSYTRSSMKDLTKTTKYSMLHIMCTKMTPIRTHNCPEHLRKKI